MLRRSRLRRGSRPLSFCIASHYRRYRSSAAHVGEIEFEIRFLGTNGMPDFEYGRFGLRRYKKRFFSTGGCRCLCDEIFRTARYNGLSVYLAVSWLDIGRIQFGQITQSGMWKLVARVSLVRFLILPLAFLVLCWAFLHGVPLSPAQLWAIFLEMHIPPATNLSLMASQVGVNEELGSFTTLITYSAHMLLLPL